MSSIKFLVVDDSATMRRIVINTLKAIGYEEVVEAGDGNEALARLAAEEVHFVITDWNMPNMNGLELTRAIRGNEKTTGLPILMVTTRGVKEDIVEALAAKVNNYIVKPFTPPVLKEKIELIMKSVAA